MKRTNITFDDDTYEYLRKKSYDERKSMAAILRDMIREQEDYGSKPPEKKCACIYVDGKLTEPCAHHAMQLSGIDPETEKKPQQIYKDSIKDLASFKTCKHGAKVGLCKKGCQ